MLQAPTAAIVVVGHVAGDSTRHIIARMCDECGHELLAPGHKEGNSNLTTRVELYIVTV
jgi:hypothetical protein